YFGSWKGAARSVDLPAPQAPDPRQIRLVDQPGSPGVELRIALPMPGTRAPEIAALAIANELLGGSVGSRLNLSGRAFGAHSSLKLLRDSGILVIPATCPADSAARVLARLRAEVTRFTRQPPSEPEVKAAARTISRAFPLQNESTAAQAAQWRGARFRGVGDDYSQRYPERIQAVTAADVKAVATRWLAPEREVVVVVGPASTIEPKLRDQGTVHVVPITAPPINLESAPAMRTATPSADELARGRKLIDQASAAPG